MISDNKPSYLASTSFRQYTVIGGRYSYGDLLFVFGKLSRSAGFNIKSDIARTGVMKFLSSDDADRSTLNLLAAKCYIFFLFFNLRKWKVDKKRKRNGNNDRFFKILEIPISLTRIHYLSTKSNQTLREVRIKFRSFSLFFFTIFHFFSADSSEKAYRWV